MDNISEVFKTLDVLQNGQPKQYQHNQTQNIALLKENYKIQFLFVQNQNQLSNHTSILLDELVFVQSGSSEDGSLMSFSVFSYTFVQILTRDDLTITQWCLSHSMNHHVTKYSDIRKSVPTQNN
ncbi:unnamed protein product (macronuclear) [Paramecium tetraurelia]|uniref:Uncharacterized protein n=1 Tax=Paramecium tetraurelia TaxID=5888 RepID=A0CIB2_PARTE|nr:uncharacterized protein GSPATT00007664001 [Paramecium tetraurelia]CAK70529.1 unnamed protein product [Paramecium tetraurelia]|eukprot:XP_001437926.1 hypothetical protein (macronuclear) [Paramecium tetraurelia strain d4-2]